MIKMVCSDLDGTLLQYGKKLIEGEIFDEIRALHDRGILFCPASGRQYTSLRKLFAPVADDCIYLCENGAVVYRGGKVIAKTPMPRALAEEIAWDFWNNTEDLGEVMLSGENMSYLMERGHGVVDRIKFIGNNYTVITDPARDPGGYRQGVRLFGGRRGAVCGALCAQMAAGQLRRGGTQVDRYHRGQQGDWRTEHLPCAGH